VNRKERAASQGISYATARRWHDAGMLAAAACQVGRLFVTGDPAPAARAGVAAVHARMSSAGQEDGPGRRVARVTGWAAAEAWPPAGPCLPLSGMRARCRPLGRAAAFFG
jgi:predicted site-specific integrase-resolvase